MSHLFISHSSKDASITNQLVSYLEANGQKCWIAPRDIAAGKDYTDVINDALENCNTIIFILSAHSLSSNWVKKEISVAMSMGKRVLPFKVARCQLTSGYLFMLNNVQIIDASSATNSHFPELLEAITGVAATTTPVPTSNKKMLLSITAAVVAIALLAAVLLLTRHGGNEEPLPLPIDTAQATAPVAGTEEAPGVPEASAAQETQANQETGKSRNTSKPNKPSKPNSPSNPSEPCAKQVEQTAEEPQPEQASPEEDEAKAKAANAAKAAKEYERKFNTAISFYMNQDYRNALAIFEELRRTNPSDKRLGNYISDCRRKLKVEN